MFARQTTGRAAGEESQVDKPPGLHRGGLDLAGDCREEIRKFASSYLLIVDLFDLDTVRRVGSDESEVSGEQLDSTIGPPDEETVGQLQCDAVDHRAFEFGTSWRAGLEALEVAHEYTPGIAVIADAPGPTRPKMPNTSLVTVLQSFEPRRTGSVSPPSSGVAT